MLTPGGISAGLHLVAWLLDYLDETAVVKAARRAGVSVDAVGPYRIESTGPGGLIFGFAACGEHAIAEGVALIARAINDGSRTGRAPRLRTGP